MKSRVMLYNANFYKIGGIETFAKNFTKRLGKKHRMTVVYETM